MNNGNTIVPTIKWCVVSDNSNITELFFVVFNSKCSAIMMFVKDKMYILFGVKNKPKKYTLN